MAEPAPVTEGSARDVPQSLPRSTLTFARDFPRDAALDRLVVLFEQGNYAQLRQDAPALLASSKDAAVQAATRELLKRLEPDPLALYLLAIAGVLLLVLAGWYWTHPHEAPPTGGPPGITPAPGPVST